MSRTDLDRSQGHFVTIDGRVVFLPGAPGGQMDFRQHMFHRGKLISREEWDKLPIEEQHHPFEAIGKGPKTTAKPELKTEATRRAAVVKAVTKRGGTPPATKAWIERTLVDEYHKANGSGQEEIENDKALAAYHNPFTFKGKLPAEITDRYEKNPHMLRQFSVGHGTGADAMHELGERYFQIAEDRAGSETTKAMEWAKKSPDPEHQLLAAEHATMPEDPASAQRAATLAKKQGKPNAERLQARAAEIKAEAKPKEMVDPSKLVEGTVGTINNIPVRVEEGELRDHGELPDTPVEALRHPVPFDKGSRHVESGHDSDEGLEDAAGSFNPDEFELESRVSARAKQLTQEKGIKPVLALALAKREMMSKIPQRPQLKTERAA